MNFNKVCNLEDFTDSDFLDILREVCAYKEARLPGFPKGTEHRKDWEVAMAIRALRHFGTVRPDSLLLGVAAGMEDTVFHLTRHCRQVFATDRYFSAGEWGPTAPVSMLVDPTAVAHGDLDPNRLVVQHMDARWLRYPDDFFDGVFSSSSIEHVGGLDDVASAAYEMGRVLKPGGVLSLSTEIRLSGPPGGLGWPGQTLVFSPENLRRYVIEASGLEPVDELDLEVSAESIANARDLAGVLADRRAAVDNGDGLTDYSCLDFPHLVLRHEEYEFTSVHLTLRKRQQHPVVANAWAAPSPEIRAAISEWDRNLLRPPPAQSAAASGEAPVPTDRLPAAEEPSAVETVVRRLGPDNRVARRLSLIARANAAVSEIDDHRAAIGDLIDATNARRETILEARETEQAGWRAADPDPPPVIPFDRIHWTPLRLTTSSSLPYAMMIDPRLGDPIASGLAAGVVFDQTLVDLMLQITQPGQIVLDIGAHLGQFSLPAAAAGCRVLAVEASPVNAALLRASAARNGFANLTVVHAAATDVPGTVDFFSNGPWGRVVSADFEQPAVTVPAVTIDALLAELGMGPVAFVKIDVEGSELETLDGMVGLLSGPDAPPVLVESNGHTLRLFGGTPADLLKRLEDLGFGAHLVDTGRLVRVRPDEFQPQTIVDYLAFKQLPEAVSGSALEPELRLEERVSRIVADSRLSVSDHRAYMASALREAGELLLSQPSIVETLDGLASDEVETVRAAAGWWPDRRQADPRTPEDCEDRP